MNLISLISNRTDRKLGKLGFKKTSESRFGASYERYNKEYNYTQILDIYKKNSGKHTINSYQVDVNSDGYNNQVGLTYQEIKLMLKKYRELKRKYWSVRKKMNKDAQ